MKRPYETWDERTRALAVEEVTSGLPRDERDELHARLDADELEEFEFSAAALSLAGLGRLEPAPAALTSRLQAAARAHFAQAGTGIARSTRPGAAPKPRETAPMTVTRPRRTVLALSGWLAAAALLAALVLQNLPGRERDAVSRRADLMARAPDLVRAEWIAGADPLAGGVNGDVVWSRARQEGYMRFRDLPPNDPARQQYQLWIFDKARDGWEARPVDGGVFDVLRGEEVVVSIAPKLEVREAALFAVTLESAGGVVVSAREHLLATATP